MLRSSSALLQKEFEGTFGAETIERFLHSSYDDFGRRISNDRYLTTFAERFARERLQGTGPRRGQERRPPAHRPLPVHPQRRPLADGPRLLPRAGRRPGDRLVGRLEPGNEVNPAAIAAMAEVGIDISGEYPKPWTDEIVRAADVVVTMGCGDACPVFPGKRYEDWVLTDPNGLDVDSVRPIRDEIKGRVERLLAQLGVMVA